MNEHTLEMNNVLNDSNLSGSDLLNVLPNIKKANKEDIAKGAKPPVAEPVDKELSLGNTTDTIKKSLLDFLPGIENSPEILNLLIDACINKNMTVEQAAQQVQSTPDGLTLVEFDTSAVEEKVAESKSVDTKDKDGKPEGFIRTVKTPTIHQTPAGTSVSEVNHEVDDKGPEIE